MKIHHDVESGETTLAFYQYDPGQQLFNEFDQPDGHNGLVLTDLGWVPQKEDYQVISSIISEAKKANRIIPAYPNQGNKYAKYIPYWAGQLPK